MPESISDRLGKIVFILQKYALGDFSESIEIPEQEDEFTELLVGLTLMADDIRERIKSQAAIVAELKKERELFIGREKRVLELKNEVNSLLKELGRQEKYGR